MGAVPAEFAQKWGAFATNIHTANAWAVLLAMLALLMILLLPRVSRRVPAAFAALIVTTLLAQLLHLPVETIGSRFGSINAGIPHPVLPDLSFTTVTALVGPAFTIAVLAAVESLLSAVVADGMIGSRHRSNMELVAQGVANIASSLFGGIPATGAIARTATNVKNGGRTPVAGMTHALTLLVITLFAGRWAALIPLATLAAILVVVAYHMSEWRVFVAEFRAPKSDVAVLLTTFILTVVVDLTVAIGVGMVLAAFLFMRRMAEVTNVTAFTREIQDASNDTYDDGPDAELRRTLQPGVQVYDINGPFFFGAAERFREAVGRVAARPRVLIIRMKNVPAIDSSGLHALTEIVHRSRKDGVRVLLADVHAQPMVVLTNSGLLDEIGEENAARSLDEALAVGGGQEAESSQQEAETAG
jgi:SulP family sulfate permease